MTRWRLLIIIAFGLFAPFPLAAGERRPNVVFVLADDLGYGDLGCYGQKKIRTPNLDRLASEGVRFTQCYSGSTVCAPSRCALMTGLHTGHARIRGNRKGATLLPEDTTVAEVLRGAGYVTGVVGKWGLGNPGEPGIPSKQGFDIAFGYLDHLHAHNSYPDHLWRHEEKVPLPNVEKGGVSSERKVYAPDLFLKEGLEFIEANKSKPFFLYFASTIPHANNERTRASGAGNEVPSDAPYTAESWPQPEKDKAAMITHLDADVGAIVAKLKELGLEKDTVIFFSSDNGPHKEGGNDPTFFDSAGPLRGMKRSLTDGGIRVPMIVRWPGVIKPGTLSDHVWAFWDFLPTAADIAGTKSPKGLDGVSVLPVLSGQEARRAEFLYWEFHEGGFKQAARHGDWKALRLAPGAKIELYNVANDIGESKDVAVDHPDIVAKIDAYMKSARSESRNWPITAPKKKG